jgi:integrase
MHSGHLLREGARPEVVRDILGHANIDVTQNVYGKSVHASVIYRKIIKRSQGNRRIACWSCLQSRRILCFQF